MALQNTLPKLLRQVKQTSASSGQARGIMLSRSCVCVRPDECSDNWLGSGPLLLPLRKDVGLLVQLRGSARASDHLWMAAVKTGS